ncbi:hypothetical protein G9A89_004674 [Geosiphon pyriformis]|nr:hypothetical protein G9A89_004674 [Geosiphon pyriformis]
MGFSSKVALLNSSTVVVSSSLKENMAVNVLSLVTVAGAFGFCFEVSFVAVFEFGVFDRLTGTAVNKLLVAAVDRWPMIDILEFDRLVVDRLVVASWTELVIGVSILIFRLWIAIIMAIDSDMVLFTTVMADTYLLLPWLIGGC